MARYLLSKRCKNLTTKLYRTFKIWLREQEKVKNDVRAADGDSKVCRKYKTNYLTITISTQNAAITAKLSATNQNVPPMDALKDHRRHVTKSVVYFEIPVRQKRKL